MKIDIGEKFAGRFSVLGIAGKGGTAWVYKAYDFENQLLVALKVFSVDGRDPDIVSELWNREVSALEVLTHDHIVRKLDAGRDSTTSIRYIVLEWIEGETLEAFFDRRGRIDWQTFMREIGSPILAALTYAAERRVTHRDLSPKNVLIQAGSPKIIDFGQAKISSTGIGLTVAGWHTVPYCPPEQDTGAYTHTRDAFSFCAIAIRALSGTRLDNHDVLYEALSRIEVPVEPLAVLTKALAREPADRYRTTVEFSEAFQRAIGGLDGGQSGTFCIHIRAIPAVMDRIQAGEDQSESEALLAELNDAVSIYPAKSEGNKLVIETQSYRLTADIDSQFADHLVIIGASQKRFNLDALYQDSKWMPQVHFIGSAPTGDQRRDGAEQIRLLYEGLEDFQAEIEAARRDHGSTILDWENLLDAFRYLAKHEVPSLRYSKLEADGMWLTATIDNPEDAEEDQVRTITVDGRWVFRGQIESVRGNVCTLVSTRRVSLQGVPNRGNLDIDWLQSRIALDRQARAVERFSNLEIPNPRLGQLLTGEHAGPDELSFEKIDTFFDGTLDPPKKTVVSRVAAGVDLLVTHGPPGTGKTKLIVELVRQEMLRNPDSKILLVSQTHAALDNALERLLKAESNISCIRIGSGSKEADPRVEMCSVDQRAKQLQSSVERSTKTFIDGKAAALGVNHHQVELAMRVSDLLGLKKRDFENISSIHDVELELQEVVSGLASADEGSPAKSKAQLRAAALEDSLDRAKAQSEVVEAEIQHAILALAETGSEGMRLSKQPDEQLVAWAGQSLGSEQQQKIGELLRLAEMWRLRFGQSNDFKAAIISSSSVVAGTCVGFCREEAASRATFDLCIVDEAGKATTTELLVPLAQSRRAVLLGDHHQLPAVIDHSLKTKKVQEKFGLRPEQIDQQLFELLTKTLAEGGKAKLTTQYRMRGAIGRLVSHCFYDDNLEPGEGVADRDAVNLALAGIDQAVTWIDPYVAAEKGKRDRPVGKSFDNDLEVRCVIAHLKRIAFVLSNSLSEKDWPTVGVITGYAPQAGLVRAAIRKDPSLDRLRVECSTVHAFQGREVDICIYSVVRKNPDFSIGMLKEWRHLNVALSRAKDYLVIVGSISFCRRVGAPFDKIVDFIDSAEGCEVKEWRDA